MNMRLGAKEVDNCILFLVTLSYILNPYLGFSLLSIYLFLGISRSSTRQIALPIIYLAVNMTIGNLYIGKFTHIQVITFVTFFICLLAKRTLLNNLLVLFKKRLGLTILFASIIVMCIVRIGGIREFLGMILLAYMIAAFADNEKNLFAILDAILIAGNQIVYVGIIEFAMQETFFYTTWTGEERYRFGILRIGSTVSDPNYVCMMLIPLFLLSFFLYKELNQSKYKIYAFSYGILCILTMSRTGWLCMMVAVYFVIRKYYFERLNHRIQGFLNFTLSLVCIAFLYTLLSRFIGTTDNILKSSNFTRTICLQYGIYLLRNNLWEGIGLYHFYEMAQPLFYRDYGGHFAEGITVMNMPLEIGLTFGIKGMIAFLLILLLTCKNILAYKKSGSEIPYLEMMLCFLVMSMTLDGMLVGLFWILIGLPANLYSINHKGVSK